MSKRAKQYGPSSIGFSEDVSLPSDVRTAFCDLLVALVEKDEDKYAPLLGRNVGVDVVGKMAAAALKKGFRVVHVEPLSEEDETRKGAVQESRLMESGSSESLTGPIGYRVYCSYQRGASDDSYARLGSFTLARAPTSYGWVVADFSWYLTERYAGVEKR
jgi:hypothetical protein